MSYENQEYRSSRYDDYDAPSHRGRPKDYVAEERRHRSDYRSEGRSRHRDYDEVDDRRPPRRDYNDRRSGGEGRNYYPSRFSPRRNEQPRPCRVLGVFGLSFSTRESDLYDVFSDYGRVEDIKMVYDNMTGKSRGFAFVYFEATEDAKRAMASCSGGLEIDGKIARVDYSLTTAPHKPTPGVYMGKRSNYDGYRSGRRSLDRPPPRRYADDYAPPSYGSRGSRYGGRNVSPSPSPPPRRRDRSPIRPSGGKGDERWSDGQ